MMMALEEVSSRNAVPGDSTINGATAGVIDDPEDIDDRTDGISHRQE